MDKLYEQTLLYDFYGELLTDHQKQIYEEVVMNDYSLSEVAREYDISRQGVHDLIRRIDKSLEEYEEKLHLVRRFLEIKNKIEKIHSLTDSPEITRLTEEILEDL
ncbi:MAG: YlxM family DNA-binding protein [Lachnospiraceae bacterium]|nr:YlxM family DNA-binding protein [Lachnospiraceae bacterium]